MKFYRIVLIFLLGILFSTTLFAQNSSELKRRKDQITKEIELLNKSLKQTSGSKKLSLKQVNALNAQIRLMEQKINTINSEIRLLNNQINGNTRTVQDLQFRLNKLKKEYAAMVVFAYRNRGSYNKLMFVFASRDFNQAYKRLKYLSQFGEYRIRQAGEIKQTQNTLNVKIKELDQDKREKNNLLQDEVTEKKTLGKQKDKQTVELNKLTKKEKQLSQQLATKQKEARQVSNALNAAINREIEAARKKALAEAAEKEKKEALAAAAKKKANPEAPVAKVLTRKPVASGTDVLIAAPEAAKLSADFQNNKGRLPWPVDAGKIVRGFGKYVDGINVISDNPGINIQTSTGASARAVFDGEVSMAQNVGPFYVVLIVHGAYFSVYSQLRSVNVSRGQKVNTKQVLGTIMTDPFDGTTQLHFEVRKGISPMNPSSWIAPR